MKKRLILTFFAVIICLYTHASIIYAQTNQSPPQEKFYKARVEKILDQGQVTSFGQTNPYQKVSLTIVDGDQKGQELTVEQGRGYTLDKNQLVQEGDTIVLVKTVGPDNTPIYQISDTYRLDKLLPILIVFFVAIILLSRWQGVGAIVGMAISLAIIAQYIVPQILAGNDPLVVSIIGCLVIMVITIYLAHGFSKKTTIALIATFLTLVATGFISVLFVKLAHLTGLGSEDAYSLKLGPTANINFKGLLLGGMLIGTLGVLDDVTTSLSASVFELAHANPKFTFKELCKSGLTIGREHISSLVNTLVLAYAGASLPIFLIIILNPNHYPFWTILNSEMIVEEIIRTLAGSMGLVAAVPLTTLLAAAYITQRKK